jgi:hypothetical protein
MRHFGVFQCHLDVFTGTLWSCSSHFNTIDYLSSVCFHPKIAPMLLAAAADSSSSRQAAGGRNVDSGRGLVGNSVTPMTAHPEPVIFQLPCHSRRKSMVIPLALPTQSSSASPKLSSIKSLYMHSFKCLLIGISSGTNFHVFHFYRISSFASPISVSCLSPFRLLNLKPSRHISTADFHFAGCVQQHLYSRFCSSVCLAGREH